MVWTRPRTPFTYRQSFFRAFHAHTHGFDILRHTDARLSLQVSADVDNAVANANDIVASLRETVLPALVERYGVGYAFEGRQSDPLGRPLQPGDIITTGTVTRAFPVAPGERWSTQMTGLPLPGLELAIV